MDIDPPYHPRSPYEESSHPRELPPRTSSHSDAISRGHVPSTSRSRRRESLNAVPAPPRMSAPVVAENARDGSPQPHHELRQVSALPSSASLLPGLPQDMPSTEDHRYHGRRFEHDRDHDREVSIFEFREIFFLMSQYQGFSPTLSRNPNNVVAPRSQSIGRYDEPEGGTMHTNSILSTSHGY
jgi:hypothetical protein